jgi:hypothetical protein
LTFFIDNHLYFSLQLFGCVGLHHRHFWDREFCESEFRVGKDEFAIAIIDNSFIIFVKNRSLEIGDVQIDSVWNMTGSLWPVQDWNLGSVRLLADDFFDVHVWLDVVHS